MVLDASAVLALVGAEPGWESVAAALPDAVISSVNLSEVVGKLADRGVPTGEIRSLLAGLGLVVVEFDTDSAYDAGALRGLDGGRSLSLGDRACLALARRRSQPAMTADRLWAQLQVGVEVHLIR